MIQKADLETFALAHWMEQAVDAGLSAADSTCERTDRYPRILEIAESIYAGEPQLMEKAQKPVLLDRLCWLIKRRKLARFQKDFRQGDLSGLELPRTILLRDGSRPRLDFCTAYRMDQAIKVLGARNQLRESPKVKRLKAARAIMEPYRLENRDITWGEVKTRELERRDFERIVGS